MENYKIEFKLDIPEKQNKLKAEIVAFLNSDGGEIILGVNDEGFADINLINRKRKEWELILSNWIVNAFSPNVTNLIQIFPNETPFKIKILKGVEKPYFFKDGEGLNSKGVYIRVGSTKRVASFDEIQRMIRSNPSSNFENIIIDRNDLTFNYVKNRFKEKKVKFDEYALSLKDTNDKYNNLALLISDQNPFISKFAVFQGKNVSIFLDKKEFKGSILKQLDDLLYFSNLSNRKKIIITGKLERDEYLDIPKRALREAIVNCFCHRDYTLSGDIKVEFFEDRVQIYSPGSLPDGLTLENIKVGMVAKRNKLLVNVFDKIDVIENYATGVRKIFEDYENFNKKPEFYISENGIIVTLYNRNYDYKNNIKLNENDFDTQKTDFDTQKTDFDTQKTDFDTQKTDFDTQKTDFDTQKTDFDTQKTDFDTQKTVSIIFTDEEKNKKISIIIQAIKNNKYITADELVKILKVSKSTVRRYLSILRERNIIEYMGGSRNGFWIVKDF